MKVPKPKSLTKEEKLKLRLEKQRQKNHERIEKVLADSKEKRLHQVNRVKEQRNKAVQKAKLMPVAKLKKIVQKEVNAYVRLRDRDEPCISCGKDVMVANADAGHYIAQGSSGALRYNLDNVNKQCDACNRYLHGNLIEYRFGLIEKIGRERVEWLEAHRHDVKKWTREELEAIREDIKENTKMEYINQSEGL